MSPAGYYAPTFPTSRKAHVIVVKQRELRTKRCPAAATRLSSCHQCTAGTNLPTITVPPSSSMSSSSSTRAESPASASAPAATRCSLRRPPSRHAWSVSGRPTLTSVSRSLPSPLSALSTVFDRPLQSSPGSGGGNVTSALFFLLSGGLPSQAASSLFSPATACWPPPSPATLSSELSKPKLSVHVQNPSELLALQLESMLSTDPGRKKKSGRSLKEEVEKKMQGRFGRRKGVRAQGTPWTGGKKATWKIVWSIIQVFGRRGG